MICAGDLYRHMSFHFTADNQGGVYWNETANLQSFISGSMVDVNNLPWSVKFQLVGYHIIAMKKAKQVGAKKKEVITHMKPKFYPPGI